MSFLVLPTLLAYVHRDTPRGMPLGLLENVVSFCNPLSLYLRQIICSTRSWSNDIGAIQYGILTEPTVICDVNGGWIHDSPSHIIRAIKKVGVVLRSSENFIRQLHQSSVDVVTHHSCNGGCNHTVLGLRSLNFIAMMVAFVTFAKFPVKETNPAFG